MNYMWWFLCVRVCHHDFDEKLTNIFVGLPMEVSLLACPWKYICCGLTVEVSSLACPWKYICWPARGSIIAGLPVEVYS